jgi:hypothetical protein
MKATEFADLALPRLVWNARRDRTITYKELAAAIPGWTSVNARLAPQMRAVQALSSQRGLPDLSRLVVSQSAGEPAEGDPDEVTRQGIYKTFRDYQRLGLYKDLEEIEPVPTA